MGHLSSVLVLEPKDCQLSNVHACITCSPFFKLHFCLCIWGALSVSHLIAFMNLCRKKGAIYELNVGKIPTSKVLKVYIGVCEVNFHGNLCSSKPERIFSNCLFSQICYFV